MEKLVELRIKDLKMFSNQKITHSTIENIRVFYKEKMLKDEAQKGEKALKEVAYKVVYDEQNHDYFRFGNTKNPKRSGSGRKRRYYIFRESRRWAAPSRWSPSTSPSRTLPPRGWKWTAAPPRWRSLCR